MSVAASTNRTVELDDSFEQRDTLEQVVTVEQVKSYEQVRAYERSSAPESPADGHGVLVQELFSQARLNDTLTMVVRLARQALTCDGVGVLLTDESGAMTPAAASDRDAAGADSLQVSTHQGPGFQVVCRQQPAIVSDLRTDSRWRFWAPKAADIGFRSVLTLALADGDTSGALNLYSRRISAFNTPDLLSGQTFAQQASIAIAVSREREQLLQALSSRTEVGRAEGILMERYGVSAPQARTVLQRYATHMDIPLAELSESVVRDRGLPKVAFSVS